MKVNQIIQIKGSLGFMWNPTMRVVDIRGDQETGMVLLESVDAKNGGLLSHMNRSWHGIDLIKRKTK